MVLPQKRKGRQGAVERVGVHGVHLDDERFYPVEHLDGGLVVSGDEGVLNQDEVDRALITIALPHHKVHEGVLFEGSIIDVALANAGTLIFSTPDPIGIEGHFTFEGACGGDATIELLENPTIADGTAVPPWNMNRNYADPVFAALRNPTLGGAPNVLLYRVLPGGTGGNAGGGSVSSRLGLEWITNPTAIYAVRLTNISGNAKPASIVVNFYTQ